MATTFPQSYVAEAWRVTLAHLRLGEVPFERLDIAGPWPLATERESQQPVPDAAPERGSSDAEIDESAAESFPASDPPSWPHTHA